MGPLQPRPSLRPDLSNEVATSPESPELSSKDFSKAGVHSEILHGLAFALQETGSDTIRWAVQLDAEPGFHGLRYIGAGDILTMKSPQGDVLFHGVVEPDYQTGSVSRGEFESERGIPVLNHLALWIQKGWSPNSWAQLFLDQTNRVELRQASYDSIKDS